MAKMIAARMHGIGDVRIEGVEKPVPGPGEILLKVEACAVCGSDIRIFRHGNDRLDYPAITGHEISGVISDVGGGTTFSVGDRVSLGADVPSMADDWSKNGMGNLSDINYAVGYQFPGGFAEYCLLNELTVKFGPVALVPDSLDLELACLAEPLGCCINGLTQAKMKPGKTVLIIGAGPIGLLLARTARAFGAPLVVIADQDPVRVQQAEELGEPKAVNSSEKSLIALIGELGLERQGFDIVLTACPSPQAQEQAVELVAKRGVVNFFGGLPGSQSSISINSNLIHYKEAFLTGSHGSTPKQHKLALELIASGRVDVAPFITHRFPLKKISEAFAVAESRLGLKAVIKPWE
jgi:L-iditol 2-dehydrogenase